LLYQGENPGKIRQAVAELPLFFTKGATVTAMFEKIQKYIRNFTHQRRFHLKLWYSTLSWSRTHKCSLLSLCTTGTCSTRTYLAQMYL